VGKKELREVKNHLVGSHAISLQRRNSLASSLALNEIYGLRYDEHIQYKKNVMQVTAEEVRAIAEKYLDPSSEVLAVLTPEG
jgi:zinc protease